MKSLYDLIYEKLVINRDTKEKTKVKIDKDKIKSSKVLGLMYGSGSPNNNQGKNLSKMEYYMKKGSKPLTLVHSIKDKTKLVNRWYAAITLNWNEAIQVFGEEIEKRGYATLEDLHGYILYQYNRNHHESFKNYLDLYNIDYDETN